MNKATLRSAQKVLANGDLDTSVRQEFIDDAPAPLRTALTKIAKDAFIVKNKTALAIVGAFTKSPDYAVSYKIVHNICTFTISHKSGTLLVESHPQSSKQVWTARFL